MSIQESIRLVDKGDYAIVEFDLIGEKVNKFSTPVMFRLKEVVEELRQSKYKAVIFRSLKEKIFIAGADIDEIKKMTKREDYMDAVTKAHEIFNALEDLNMVTIVAIHGACMGGGTEFSLACDYRISTLDKATKIGLPETQLGIIPGFGGCVRMPQKIGLPNALDIILAGKAVNSQKAKKMGLVDKTVPPESLMDIAEDMAKLAVKGEVKKSSRRYQGKSVKDKLLHSFLGRQVVFNQAKKALLKQTKGHYPAPMKALDVIRDTFALDDRERALLIESSGFCDVAVTDVSKNLINLFYLLEDVKKENGVEADVKGLDVKKIGVLGAGVMGGGIAYVAANKGFKVRMKDINNDAIAKGFKAARDIWNKKVKRKRMTENELEEKMSHISGGTDYAEFKEMQLVIEAIVEDMNIKKAVIGETAGQVTDDCVIATNTSSLSVTEMAKGHPKPENFVGMHFFNPVDKMPLVEVIRGEKTSDVATATVFETSKAMGKTPVVVKDGPGFLVNRLLFPYMTEGVFFLEEGMDIKVVDKYFTHKFGMPMGPFRLMDEVGLDVAHKVLKIFHESLGDRVEMPKTQEKLSATDRLGKKNKKGFYLYDEKDKHTDVDSTVYKDLGLDAPKSTGSSKECIERAIFQMINEAARVLYEDRIVEDPGKVDLAMIMGTGFPPFRGGLLRYADSLGRQYIVDQLDEYATRFGPRFKPCQALVNMAKNNKSFY